MNYESPLKTPFYHWIHVFEGTAVNNFYQMIRMGVAGLVRACSHEPGTVNYPEVLIAPGQALPRVHMIISCPGATSLSSNYYEFIWIPLVLHKLLQRMSFKYVYLFLVLSGTFYFLNINNEHAQNYSCPGATFAFCSHGKMLPRQGGLPGVWQRVTQLLKLPRGN